MHNYIYTHINLLDGYHDDDELFMTDHCGKQYMNDAVTILVLIINIGIVICAGFTMLLFLVVHSPVLYQVDLF